MTRGVGVYAANVVQLLLRVGETVGDEAGVEKARGLGAGWLFESSSSSSTGSPSSSSSSSSVSVSAPLALTSVSVSFSDTEPILVEGGKLIAAGAVLEVKEGSRNADILFVGGDVGEAT